MKVKYLSILYHLKQLGGADHVGEVTTATGLDAKDVNNALRYLAPEYVQKTGKLPAHKWNGPGRRPNILTLTQKGSEKADEYTQPEPNTFDERIDTAFESLWAQNARLERQFTAVQKKQRKLERLYLNTE